MDDSYADMQQTDPAEGSGGYCIKIHVSPDGMYTVSREPEDAPPDGTPAESLDEALMIAKDMAESGETGSEEDAMASAMKGYGKRPGQEMAAPNPGAVFGE